MGELQEALGGPEGQPRALLDRRQAPGGRSWSAGRSSRGGSEAADLLDGPRTGRGEPGGAA